MTLGERERVPFVRHDYFVQEWEAVGRILVKGFVSVSYFPTFFQRLIYATASLATKFQIPCLLIHLQSTYPQ